jgi:hypothetical protein
MEKQLPIDGLPEIRRQKPTLSWLFGGVWANRHRDGQTTINHKWEGRCVSFSLHGMDEGKGVSTRDTCHIHGNQGASGVCFPQNNPLHGGLISAVFHGYVSVNASLFPRSRQERIDIPSVGFDYLKRYLRVMELNRVVLMLILKKRLTGAYQFDKNVVIDAIKVRCVSHAIREMKNTRVMNVSFVFVGLCFEPEFFPARHGGHMIDKRHLLDLPFFRRVIIMIVSLTQKKFRPYPKDRTYLQEAPQPGPEVPLFPHAQLLLFYAHFAGKFLLCVVQGFP